MKNKICVFSREIEALFSKQLKQAAAQQSTDAVPHAPPAKDETTAEKAFDSADAGYFVTFKISLYLDFFKAKPELFELDTIFCVSRGILSIWSIVERINLLFSCIFSEEFFMKLIVNRNLSFFSFSGDESAKWVP